MLMDTNDYRETLGRVVGIVEKARVRAMQSVNAELVRMYWNVSAEINAHAEWGNKYIDSLSRDIRAAFPQIKGFSVRSLKYMAKFNREVDAELCSSCCTIPWGHVMLLLDKIELGSLVSMLPRWTASLPTGTALNERSIQPSGFCCAKRRKSPRLSGFLK